MGFSKIEKKHRYWYTI